MICLDSDCIIDFLKGKKEAINVINKYNEEIITTEINVFEVLYGIYLKKEVSEKQEYIAKEFLNSIIKFSFDKKCGEISAKLLSSLTKKGEAINQNDCFIASIMIKNNCNKIITNNVKHFSRIKEIKVISY
ncbi:type II toxin-antitoxin system VapC family toxin [Candidatus Pacearchaeota archaeon]|nr:type II toxin-antitoxin system VapC family toxin [Candidatus Pacearchaeota archaeon]